MHSAFVGTQPRTLVLTLKISGSRRTHHPLAHTARNALPVLRKRDEGRGAVPAPEDADHSAPGHRNAHEE